MKTDVISDVREVNAMLSGLPFEVALSVMRDKGNVLRVEEDPIYPFFDFDYKGITSSVYKDDNGDGCYLGKWVEVYDDNGMPLGYISTDDALAGKIEGIKNF